MGLDCKVLSILLYVKIVIIRCLEKLKERKRNEKRERKKNKTKQTWYLMTAALCPRDNRSP